MPTTALLTAVVAYSGHPELPGGVLAGSRMCHSGRNGTPRLFASTNGAFAAFTAISPLRPGQVRAGQVRAGQVRARQVHAGQVRAGLVATSPINSWSSRV